MIKKKNNKQVFESCQLWWLFFIRLIKSVATPICGMEWLGMWALSRLGWCYSKKIFVK